MDMSQALLLYRIDDFEEWKTLEMGVMGVDSSNSMLSHENRGVRIEYEIAGNPWDRCNRLFEYFLMPWSFLEDSCGRRSERGIEKRPGLADRKRSGEDARVRRYPQEFVDNAPCQVPRLRPAAPFREKSAADSVSR